MMTRRLALAAGLPTYWNGKPCKHGHDIGRYTSSGACVECAKSANARLYAERGHDRDPRPPRIADVMPGHVHVLVYGLRTEAAQTDVRILVESLSGARWPDANPDSFMDGGTPAGVYKIRCHYDDIPVILSYAKALS